MKRRDFLVEIGTEELPPKNLKGLSAAFEAGVVAGLVEAGIEHGATQAYATPRRLAVWVRKVAEYQPEQKIERKGPPVSAAFDDKGQPTRAATAFAESCGVEVRALKRVSEPRGEVLFYSGSRPGRAAVDMLPEIVQKSLDGMPVARRMRWGSGEASFVRPAHWLVMIYGKEVVDCELLGLRAGRETRGHRFHAPKPIRLRTPAGYEKALRARGHVLADFAARRERVREGVIAAARETGGEAHPEDALLDEVTSLVEWPVPVVGRFEQRYLSLPAEALVATLQDHQRYFPVRNAEGGLLPAFITVANIESRDPEQVRLGNERVVRPRLADAAFFFETDRKQTLASRAAALGGVVFQAKLGTLEDKSRRTSALALLIARQAGGDEAMAERAAQLSKCDLLTAMVGEFPSLQGVMGKHYALLDREPDEVAAALAEQYLPRFAGDALPGTMAGMALAIADKLDTLVGIFAIGQKPTGARDPFGLRRAALGVLRILIEKRVDLELNVLITAALESAAADIQRINPKALPPAPGVAAEIYDYVMERLRAYYLESGKATAEMFEAVLEKRPASPLDFDARLVALADFLSQPDAASLAAANKRISNILRKAGDATAPRVDAALFKEPAERRLATELEGLRPGVEELLEARRYTEALRKLATLRPAVDEFFDGVMVMAEDRTVRANRLALLAALQRLFLHTADLSRLPG